MDVITEDDAQRKVHSLDTIDVINIDMKTHKKTHVLDVNKGAQF